MYKVYQNGDQVFEGAGKAALAIFSVLTGWVYIVDGCGCLVMEIK